MSTEAWFRMAGLFALTATLIARVGISSDAGRLLSAIRDNEMRCAYLGLDTARIRIALLVLCAIVAALAGSGYAGFGGIAAPENASFTFGTQLVIMVALGGRGTLVGAIAGALLIETASAYLSGSLPFVWELIIGVSFIVVIVVLPRGLFGGLRDVLGATARAKLSEPSAITLETTGRTAPVRPRRMWSSKSPGCPRASEACRFFRMYRSPRAGANLSASSAPTEWARRR